MVIIHLFIKFFKQFSQEQIENFEVCYDIDECLQRLQFDDNLAVAASRLHVQTLELQEDIFCFDRSQNIHDYSAVFMIHRDFSLKSEFIRIFNKIISSGLVIKWQRNQQNYRKARISDENHSSLKEFFITVAFIAIPIITVVFTMELFIHYKRHSKDRNLFWILCDKIISGKRNFFLSNSENDSQWIFRELFRRTFNFLKNKFYRSFRKMQSETKFNSVEI